MCIRDRYMGMSSEKGFEKLVAKVPLKEMSSYSTSLSSLTGGRASFIMKFSSYELVPADVQDKLVKEFEAKQVKEEQINFCILKDKSRQSSEFGDFFLTDFDIYMVFCSQTLNFILFLQLYQHFFCYNKQIIKQNVQFGQQQTTLSQNRLICFECQFRYVKFVV
eukprot:TRINITY_DN14164_c0_g1_i2.p2 TRINITY_DN14164_c0_g1~~TRINITY_DN14164_c0_g1_i2.p2  ORF type:complete len:164 (+),score=18.62 TRINITY_DN14164_c0_g1_i2:120-611(+)